jgi:hypothetical protein
MTKEPPTITKYWNHIESNLDETIQRRSSDKVGASESIFTREQSREDQWPTRVQKQLQWGEKVMQSSDIVTPPYPKGYDIEATSWGWKREGNVGATRVTEKDDVQWKKRRKVMTRMDRGARQGLRFKNSYLIHYLLKKSSIIKKK